MATMNGISLKKIKRFRGMEGYCLQGYLYLENKEIGFWSQDMNGGPDYFDLYGVKQYRLQDKIKSEYPRIRLGEAEFDYDLEYFMMDLIRLIEDEKQYKKAVKAGFGAIYVCGDTIWRVPPCHTKKDVQKHLGEQLEEARNSYSYSASMGYERYYARLDQFEVGKPFSIEELNE